MSRINVMQPWMGEAEIAAVSEVIASGWVAQGPRVAAFEKAFAQRMDADHAVATSSCTTALHLAMLVAGIRPGDEVVVPSFSFIATANAVVYVGATPVFADVDPQTGNLSSLTVEPVLSDRTRAVIAVDQGGVPVELHGASAAVRPTRHHCCRRCRVRRGLHLPRSSGRCRCTDCRVVLPSPQDRHNGRRWDAHNQ